MNAKADAKTSPDSGLDHALDEAIATVPGCVMAGYADLATGVMLGVRSTEAYPQEALDLASNTAADLFGHPDLTSIENWVLQGEDGDDVPKRRFEEFVILSDQLMHLYASSKEHGEYAVVLVAKRSANFGMLMAKSRQAVNLILTAA